MFSYIDMYKKIFKDDPNVTVRELPDSFKIPDWDRASAREEVSMRMAEVEQKRQMGLSLVKSLRMPCAVTRRDIKR